MKLQAQQLSIEEAKTNILETNFNQTPKIRKAIKGDARSLRHVYTASSNKASNLFYAFDVGDNQGFVIASADKRATPIIGFSEMGNFDIDSIPCNMYELLAGYEREIAWVIENNIQYEVNSALTYNNINPLINSKWNQYTPYKKIRGLSDPLSSVVFSSGKRKKQDIPSMPDTRASVGH